MCKLIRSLYLPVANLTWPAKAGLGSTVFRCNPSIREASRMLVPSAITALRTH